MLSLLINFCYTSVNVEGNDLNAIETQYREFTGSNPSSESVWQLTGIYTAYGQDENGDIYTGYGYTKDGWIYGARIVNYAPSQYADAPEEWNAQYDDSANIYRYAAASTGNNKHAVGDEYGAVVMDASKKSDIFFSSGGKVEMGRSFYYQFNGWRYVWQPTDEYVTSDRDGNEITIIPNTTSLSLIWYDFYAQNNGPGGSGLAGQLVLSGSDGSVAYLTKAQIVSAFNHDNSTSKFLMTFNGVDMNVYIRLDPSKLARGLTVEECYEYGYWAVMISSNSVDTSSVISSSFDFNPYNVFFTMIDLLTFHTEDYGLTGLAGALASIVIVVPLAVGIIVLGLNNYIILILAGIYGVLSAFSWGLF